MKTKEMQRRLFAWLLALVLFISNFAGYADSMIQVQAAEVQDTEEAAEEAGEEAKEPEEETEESEEETEESEEETEESEEEITDQGQSSENTSGETQTKEQPTENGGSSRQAVQSVAPASVGGNEPSLVAASSDEPAYDSSVHALKYEASSVTSNAAKTFGDVSLAAEETYYMSFTYKGRQDIAIRNDAKCILKILTNGYMYLSENGMGDNNGGNIGGIGALNGETTITICSTPTDLTVWVGGEKKWNVPLPSSAKNTGAKPQIVGVNNTTMSNLKIWTAKTESDVPVYDESVHDLLFTKDAFALSNTLTTFNEDLSLASVDTYWMRFDWVTTATTDIHIRNVLSPVTIKLRNGELHIFEESANTNTKSVRDIEALRNNATVTIASTPTTVTVWVNETKLIDSFELQENNQNQSAKPAAQYGSGELSNVQIWINKMDHDEPTYTEETGTAFTVNHVSTGTIAEDGTITVPANSDGMLLTDMPYNTSDYYGTMTLRSGGTIDIGWRGEDKKLTLDTEGYAVNGGARVLWPRNLSTTGVKVTVHSTASHTTLWMDGRKIYDENTSDGNALFGVLSSNGNEVTVNNVKIWTTSTVPSSTVPVYNPTTDEQYTVNAVTGTGSNAQNVVFEDGVVTIPEDTGAILETGLPTYADYYVSMVAKTSGTLKIKYRDQADSYITLSKNEYHSVGTDGNSTAKKNYFLQTGSQITYYAASDKFQIWINGEKIVDASYTKGGLPKLTFEAVTGEVEVSDIQIWAPDKEPVKAESDYEFPVTYVTNATSYSEGIAVIPAEKTAMFLSKLPYNADYYTSMLVKTTGGNSVNICWKGTSSYLQMNNGGFQMIKEGTAQGWQSRRFDFATGVRITIASVGGRTKIWANGIRIYNDEFVASGNSMPGISWTFSQPVTVSDMKIWASQIPTSDEPVYNELTDYKYPVKSVSGTGTNGSGVTPIIDGSGVVTGAVVPAAAGVNLNTDLPSNAAYYATMTAKTDGYLNIGFRNSKDGYIHIQPTQYKLGDSGSYVNHKFYSFVAGARVTWYSSPDKVQIWIDGEKIVDADYTAGGAPKVGLTWTFNNQVTLNDIHIWTKTAPVSEPTFDESEDTAGSTENTTGTLVLEDGETYNIYSKIEKTDTFHMSFKVKTNGSIWLNYRSPGKFLIDQNQYGVVGIGSSDVYVPFSGLRDGVRVTVESSPTYTSIWLNGVCVADKVALTPSRARMVDASEYILPSIYATGEVEISDFGLWAEGETTLTDDTPVYDENVGTKYPVTKVTGGTLEEGIVKVAPEGSSFFVSNLPRTSDYYVSMLVQSEGSVNLRFRGKDVQLVMNKTGYQFTGDDSGWVTYPLNMKRGVNVTIHSSDSRTEIWLNHIKIVDAPYSGNGSAMPGVQWSNDNEVTVKNIQIWSNSAVVSDEPVYKETTDHKYELLQITGATKENGIYKLPAQKSGLILCDLPYNASYYLSMTVKTEGGLNLIYRDDQGAVYMDKNQYKSSGTDGLYVSKELLTLGIGTRITYYSTPDKIQLWIDGEKILDSKYTKGGVAVPSIGWTFDNPVEISDVLIWTKEDPKSDEPVFKGDKSELEKITSYGNGVYKDGILTVKPLTNAYFATGFDFDTSYYMSFVVQTEGAINANYRNPNGFLNITSKGYISSGTEGKWVNKPFKKLPYGMRITLYSTPDWITIWANGEKIVNEAYKREGEAYPGIGWSFDKEVKLWNIKLWRAPEGEQEYLGDLEKAFPYKLSRRYEYGVELFTSQVNYQDEQPTGQSVPIPEASMKEAEAQIVASAVKHSSRKLSEVQKMIGVVTVTVGAAAAAIVCTVFSGRKKHKK